LRRQGVGDLPTVHPGGPPLLVPKAEPTDEDARSRSSRRRDLTGEEDGESEVPMSEPKKVPENEV